MQEKYTRGWVSWALCRLFVWPQSIVHSLSLHLKNLGVFAALDCQVSKCMSGEVIDDVFELLYKIEHNVECVPVEIVAILQEECNYNWLSFQHVW